MPRLYRYDGFESVGSIANAATSGTIINAPGVGFSIYLLGSTSFSTQRFQETNSTGATIIQVSTGIADFPATIQVKENTAVYSVSSQPSSLFYYIDNA
jgi:hypothetical protein